MKSAFLLLLAALFGCSHTPVPQAVLTAPLTVSSGAHKALAMGAVAGSLGRVRGFATAQVRHCLLATQRNPSAPNFNRLAEAYVMAEDYGKASQAYYRESAIYAHRDDSNTSLALLRLAQRYESTAGIYITRPTLADDVRSNYTAARNEPVYGCLTGAFIDHETSLKPRRFDNDWRRDVGDFNRRTGVHHALYFIYLGYGKRFPTQWINHLKENGAGAQIAFEPTSYGQVKDDAYLRGFARAAKASGVPIFLRFASEMNGDWVVYHKSAARYIEMFQLVARVMHEEAPNVAMVWCPFEIPQRYILPFYPGKEAVDWVGINIYSVLFNDNDPGRNAQNRNPADALKFIYNRFSSIHPIMIGEYAAANMSSLDMVPRSDYAIIKMEQFYSSLPRLYPRVKAIHWLSMNAIKHAYPGRQLNNYSVLDDPDVTAAYGEVNGSPYFLKEYEPKATAPRVTLPIGQARILSGKVSLSAWVKTYSNIPTVVWLVDGREYGRDGMPGSYPLTLDTTTLKNGPAKLTLVVIDQAGYQVLKRSEAVVIRNR